MEHCETDPNPHKTYGNTALHEALIKNHVDVVRLLMEHGETDPNPQNTYGNTALHEALIKNHVDVVRLLMEHGETDPNIHYKPGEGYTTLHHAAHGNRVEVVRLLMEHGETDPNIQKKFGYTALRVAASQKHVEDMRGNEVVRSCPTSSLLTVSAQCPFAIGKSGSESSFSLTGCGTCTEEMQASTLTLREPASRASSSTFVFLKRGVSIRKKIGGRLQEMA